MQSYAAMVSASVSSTTGAALQGLHGLQGFFAAQGLQGFFAAAGLQGFFAAQGFAAFAEHGPHGFFAAQGLAAAAVLRRGMTQRELKLAAAPAQGLQGFLAAQGLHGFFAAQGLERPALHGFLAAQGLQARFAAQGLARAGMAVEILPIATAIAPARPAAAATGITVEDIILDLMRMPCSLYS